jgi:hypothetical protein
MYNFSICEGTTQTHAKAHPSIRQLRVIQELAAVTGNASPASVCWKDLTSTPSGHSQEYGYDPALKLLLNTMGPQLSR